MTRYTAFFILLVSITSCQKVINVDLNGSDPQYVVEGNITDKPGPQTVKITRSVNFSSQNQFPQVTGAFVTVADETASVLDTLKETSPGIYETTAITGVPGHKYSLVIKTAGKVFTSSSIMPQVVKIDSIKTEKSVFGGTDLFAVPYYTDPLTEGNCYRLVQSVNRVPVKGSDIRNDEVTNGQVAKFPLYYDTEADNNPKIHTGDSVFITLQTIDKNVFEFYRTLQETIGQNSAALANPLTNVAGGALGYFSASTIRETGVMVK